MLNPTAVRFGCLLSLAGFAMTSIAEADDAVFNLHPAARNESPQPELTARPEIPAPESATIVETSLGRWSGPGPCRQVACGGCVSCADEDCGDCSCWLDEFCSLTDCLKNRPLWLGHHDAGTLTFGGQLRHRYHHEADRIRPGGPGTATYDLWRWRNWLDYRNGRYRVYFESIDASQFGEELPPTAIDVNRWDVQNAFLDVDTFERDGRPVVVRVGRQDLQYGAQRLVSPLDFSNTRRNFEGVKVFRKGAAWDIDAFATRPVNTATGNGPLARFDHESDHADASRTFSGVYGTYHAIADNTFDVYWLWLREQDEMVRPPRFADGSRHTVGMRWAGRHQVLGPCCEPSREWSWDFEGAYQFGHDEVTETVKANFLTGTVNHTWTSMAWKPKVTGLLYWGSGDDEPGDDENNTFSVLFPLGHAYWGLIDNLSGQNLIDYSVQASVSPTDKLSVLAAFHWFDLASTDDVLYNVAGVPVGRPGTGGNVGNETDLVVNYKANECLGVQLLFSWFHNGTFIDNNIRRDDATLFYVQTTYDY